MSNLTKPPILDDTGQTIKTKLTAILQSLQNIAIDLSSYMKKGVDYVTAGKAHGTTVGTGSTVEGTNNTVTGQYNTVEGHDNTVSASYSHCGGYQNTVAGSNAFAHGVGLKTNGGEAVFGRYNAVDALGNYHFIVGNGTSNNNRKNAFMIDNSNGDGWFGNDIYAGRSNGINVSTAQGQKKIPTSQDVVSYLNSNFGDITIVPKKNVSFTFSNNKGSQLSFATVFGNNYDKSKLLCVVGNLYGAMALFTLDSTKSNIIAYCTTEALNGTYTASFIGVFSK